MSVEKVIREGLVAVLVSPGYGAGWSTWSDDKSCLYWPAFVAWVEAGKPDPMPNAPDDFYTGGAHQLRIEWIPVGTRFRVDEYDGAESIVFADAEQWEVA